MNRREAERLLGGHAAGILTEAERRILFEAALDHQEIFDALMDEEALRELLADPEMRRRLLALLETPVRPLWHRPAVLSLAASLFLALTTSVMLLKNPRTAFQPLAADKDLAPQAKAAPAPGTAESSAPAQEASRPAAPHTLTRTPAPQAAIPRSAAPMPAAPPASAPPPQAADQARLEEAEAAPSKTSQEAPAATAKVAAKASVNADTKAEVGAQSFAAPAGAAPAPRAKAMAAAKRAIAFQPVLEALPGARFRLTVAWGPGGQLYAVKRHAGGAEVLKPLRTSGEGELTTVFELSLEPQDALDVYRLEAPAADPASLPASSAVPGEWRRVFPRNP